MQYLVIIALIAIVYFFFIKKKPIVHQEKKTKEKKLESGDMVECPTCGVYTEIDDAILSNGKYYCSQECLEK